MRKITVLLTLTALLALPGAAAAAPVDLDKLYGPRVDKLCMMIILNPDAQIMAAESGELDILGDITRPSDIERLARSKKVELSLARGYHGFFLLMNNKDKIWSDARVRRAAAAAIDRNNIVRTIFSGYSEPINGWLPPVSPWALPDTGSNRYDPQAARGLLREAGYTWNLAGQLVAPDGRPVKKIKLMTPLARMVPTTNEVAERIADALAAVGFPVEVEPLDFSTIISRLDRRDYSLGVLAWSMGGRPTTLYTFFHSSSDVESGYNVTSTGDRALDEALSEAEFAKNKKDAERASAKAQKLLEELVPSVPIYSRFSVSASSKRWKNVLATQSTTADNIWTILAAEPADGKPRTLNVLLAEEPRNLNPIVTSSAYSWNVLGLIYEQMLGSDPWTGESIPQLAKEWRVRTEESGGKERTVLEFELRNDVFWNDGKKFTARDVAATIEFLRDNKTPRFFDAVKTVAEVEVRGDYSLTVKMSGVSYWQLERIGGLPCLPKHALDRITDWQTWDPLDKSGKSGPAGLVGTGPFIFDEYKPGEYVMLVKNPYYRLLKNKKESGGEVWGK